MNFYLLRRLFVGQQVRKYQWTSKSPGVNVGTPTAISRYLIDEGISGDGILNRFMQGAMEEEASMNFFMKGTLVIASRK